jgi:rod shape-determining protein MreC
MIDTTPPPFFKRGLPPVARLTIFSLLALILMVADGRYHYLGPLRQTLAVLINPLQHAVNSPVRLGAKVGEFFVTQSRMRADNSDLREAQLLQAGKTIQFQALQAENAYLRGLLAAQPRYSQTTQMAEMLYSGRDPFSRKIIIDRGSLAGVKPGQVVTDAVGVIGQVTRVYTVVSEVTLITDKDQAVPVQNVRNGLRAVVFGNGESGTLDVPFMPVSADLQNGDELVTSGIDGVYPPGLPVAVVSKIERNTAYPFAKISCVPSAGVDRHRQMLILGMQRAQPLPPRPEEPEKEARARTKR